MATLLSIVQNVCEETGFMEAPAAVAAAPSNDRAVKQLHRIVNKVGKAIRDKYWWRVLQKEYALTLVTSTAAYAKPADFNFIMPETIWNRSDYWPIRGPLAAIDWQQIKSGAISIQPYQRFRIKGANSLCVFIDPTPTSSENGQSVYYEYCSTNWCKTTGATTWDSTVTLYEEMENDTDEPLFSADLMEQGVKAFFMELKRFEGWENEIAKFWTAVEDEHRAEVAGESIPMRRGRTGRHDWPNVPQTGINSYSSS